MAAPPIRLYNTLSRQVAPLKTIDLSRIGMYVCGVTTYDHSHLGHALSAVAFDTIRRYLELRGYLVNYICNFTDVDDKIIARANEEGCDHVAISERYIASYFEDMDRLGVRRASVHPRASENIDDIIDMVEGLIANYSAYVLNGDVYFNVKRFLPYGKLSGRRTQDQRAGARIAVDQRLRNPEDFALWKSAKEGEPAWESPWGPGRPGWHIECSVMSVKYLGQPFDIHGGGSDLIFPHHENEIAQSEAVVGKPMAKIWMHNGLLRLKGEKMSKSIGNVLGLKRLLSSYSGDAVRHYLLGKHYRSPQTFEEGSLDEAERAVDRIRNLAARSLRVLRSRDTGGATPVPSLVEARRNANQTFHEAMSEDFNTPAALAAIFDLVGEANKALSEIEGGASSDELAAGVNQAVGSVGQMLEHLGYPMAIMGRITGKTRASEMAADLSAPQGDPALLGPVLELMVSIREQARSRKDFTTADSIRDGLGKIGIELNDGPEGTSYLIRRKPGGPSR